MKGKCQNGKKGSVKVMIAVIKPKPKTVSKKVAKTTSKTKKKG